MPLFKKNKPLIPPVQSELAPPGASRSSSRSTSSLPSYRSNASTYVPSRDGPDPYSTTERSKFQSGVDDYEPSVETSTSDAQAQLTQARGELFAGYNPEKAGSGRFFDGPDIGREPLPGEENDEDVEGIKQQTRFLKQESVNSTRNALRMAREAEETAQGTLGRLADQSEKLANTERHLDVSKTHTSRAGDQIDELKKLNRSIFRPAITFNKDAKRAAQEAKIQQRYEDERREREKAMLDIRDTQNRLGRAATYGQEDEDEGIQTAFGNSRFRTTEQLAARKEQRKRYQFEAGGSDDEVEDEIDDNLGEISSVTKSLKALGTAMGQELDAQNKRLDVIANKATSLDDGVFRQTERLKRIK
ncbi:hypothetical protein L210DRAFT_3610525 [Boletus edulis BED1]|uniref:t-SNARE coiled-coil homology domain-containing protein n=1 Tax=Boletus edulis BED1 TaxID=1328754 RepID=A0AAD4C2A7_BOLED|nr:hypothetical protein L210DRAFT_3610525 [Boletus edulis BED1]